MKAARFHGRKDIRIEDIPEPELRAGAVKIDVAWCGICGTDLHEYLEGPIFCPAPGHPHPLSHEESPVTLGHEFSGTVSEVGDGVEGLAVGDNVVVEPYFVDGDCDMCQAGSYHLCRQMGFIGLSGGGGGLSEKIVVDKRWVHPIGDIPLDEAALIEPLSVAHHAVARSGAKAGDVALVGGSGPIGLLTAAVLKGMGVTTIISELTQARKEKAVSSRVADHVLDPSQEDVPARVLELTGGTGADVAFECAGVNAVLDTMLDAVRPGEWWSTCPSGARPPPWTCRSWCSRRSTCAAPSPTSGTIPRSSRWCRRARWTSSPSSPAESRWRTSWSRASTPSSTTRTPP
jgi:(R,R)-butanediol dehydrogenase/meso-butanediol dehydrogenase/diacetyl reductase